MIFESEQLIYLPPGTGVTDLAQAPMSSDMEADTKLCRVEAYASAVWSVSHRNVSCSAAAITVRARWAWLSFIGMMSLLAFDRYSAPVNRLETLARLAF